MLNDDCICYSLAYLSDICLVTSAALTSKKWLHIVMQIIKNRLDAFNKHQIFKSLATDMSSYVVYTRLLHANLCPPCRVQKSDPYIPEVSATILVARSRNSIKTSLDSYDILGIKNVYLCTSEKLKPLHITIPPRERCQLTNFIRVRIVLRNHCTDDIYVLTDTIQYLNESHANITLMLGSELSLSLDLLMQSCASSSSQHQINEEESPATTTTIIINSRIEKSTTVPSYSLFSYECPSHLRAMISLVATMWDMIQWHCMHWWVYSLDAAVVSDGT